MDSHFIEMARDVELTRPFTPTSPSDALWVASTMTVSPDTPFSAGPRISNDHRNFDQHDAESLFKPQTTPYELDATVPPKSIVNSKFNACPRDSAPQALHDRPQTLRKKPASGIPSLSTAHLRPAKDAGATPATAIHHSMALDATKNQRRGIDKGNEDDPFLGTGKPMRRSSINSVTPRTSDILTSPSPARLRSSPLGGTPGLLTLHDAHDDVLSLLDTLQTTHKNQTKKEVDAALMRCQKDMKARAKDKNTGTAESNILDREAARIGRARDETNRQTPEDGGATSPGEGAIFEESLRLALTRLMQDARAALDAVAQAKSQVASASRAASAYTPYRAGEDFRLTALNFENRTLSEKLKRLKAEKEQAQKENSDLQRRVDELMTEVKARRRDQPFEVKLGPWGKEWNIDGRTES